MWKNETRPTIRGRIQWRTLGFTLMLLGAIFLVNATVRANVATVDAQTIYLPVILNDYPPIPSQPQLSVAIGDTAVTLSWTTEQAGLIDYYLLEVSDSAEFDELTEPAIQVNGTSYVYDMSAVIGTRYFRVAGVNQFGTGPWSNTVDATVTRLTADKLNLNADLNECTTLRWNYTGISAFFINYAAGFDKKAADGVSSAVICPSVTTVYEATVVYPDGRTENPSVTVEVTGDSCNTDPYVDYFESTSYSVLPGERFTILWKIECATGVYYSAGGGAETAVTGEESREVQISSDTLFKLRITGPNGFNDNASFTVFIR